MISPCLWFNAPAELRRTGNTQTFNFQEPGSGIKKEKFAKVRPRNQKHRLKLSSPEAVINSFCAFQYQLSDDRAPQTRPCVEVRSWARLWSVKMLHYGKGGDHAGSEACAGVRTRRRFRPVKSTDQSDGPAPGLGSRKNINTRPLGDQVGPSSR